MMKQNLKFFSIVLSLLLLSALVLTGCMHAIAADRGGAKPYDLNGQTYNSEGSGSVIVEGDAPTAQTELQKKFSAYLHRDGNIVTVFSEEQYAELKAVRENDKRNPLTYEEILFLVNDSIHLYFTCEEIRLTNANRDHVLPLLSNQSGNARIIIPEYKSAAAYETYNEAINAYYRMLTDIYELIYYRIYMHDAGFEMVHHTYHGGKEYVFGNRYYGDLGMINSAVPQGLYQMLAIDDATFSGIDNEEKLVYAYKTLLEWKGMYEMDSVFVDDHYPYLDSAVLYTNIWNIDGEPMECRFGFYIVGPKDDPVQQIYPTAELGDMMPHQEFLYEVSASDDQMQPWFALNYENGTVSMGPGRMLSVSILGTFGEYDGVLKLYFDENSYVFNKCEDGYVYSAENSKPISGGIDFADGLVFKKVHEGVSTKPNPDPPIDNNETNPPVDNPDDNQNEVAMPYFKLDPVGGVCSLMTPDGNSYADGIYVQEGDAHILYFGDEFWYVFYYNEGVGYEYFKGESAPVPGYEFEDGQLFSPNDDSLTALFLTYVK